MVFISPSNISPEFSNENDFNLSEKSPVIDLGRETSITLDIWEFIL